MAPFHTPASRVVAASAIVLVAAAGCGPDGPAEPAVSDDPTHAVAADPETAVLDAISVLESTPYVGQTDIVIDGRTYLDGSMLVQGPDAYRTSALLDDTALPGGEASTPLDVQTLVVGGEAYFALEGGAYEPYAGEFGNGTWVHVPADLRPDFELGLGMTAAHHADYALEAAAGLSGLEHAGGSTVEGLLSADGPVFAPSPDRDTLLGPLEGRVVSDVPVDIVLDGEGRFEELSFTLTLEVEGHGPVEASYSIEFFEWGDGVDLSLPEGDTVEARELMEHSDR
ncbi:hypothetical protein [Salininema proteolyticum]|uniref:Lipoprotein LprG n=1 Tax=Salininema proteolyticum TaxID=1607685 RepID=A0ABV8U100_9ACTN